uniref:Uncharacterized protein n=1 Tax=virus sp. ctBM815 TaxID=2825806 RepID=A0A8S5RKC1_9VIRU|nr:MAG TPA: hypothetical protein [virus sp. ctBM815]
MSTSSPVSAVFLSGVRSGESSLFSSSSGYSFSCVYSGCFSVLS